MVTENTYVVIDDVTGIVKTIIDWDQASPYDPGEGLSLLFVGDAHPIHPGYVLDTETLTTAVPETPAGVVAASPADLIADIRANANSLSHTGATYLSLMATADALEALLGVI